MLDKWAEQLARMEALFSRGNIFSTPKTSVSKVPSQDLISTTPFLAPSARSSSPVEIPAVQDDHSKSQKEDKDKKKAHKSHRDKDTKHSKKRDRTDSLARTKATTSTQACALSPSAKSHSGPELDQQPGTKTMREKTAMPKNPPSTSKPAPGPSGTGQASIDHPSGSDIVDQNYGGACAYPPESEDTPFTEDHFTDSDVSGSLSEPEDLLSDTTEKTELTEDMNYRETIHSVRSFMGWHHVLTFESDFTEPDKSNNPWKGKNPKRPTRVSVAMPPDDWLCQKLERLNLTVVEGYPCRAQDSTGLKKHQFVKVPKSQSRWYKIHMLKLDRPHRQGRSVFNWHNTEAKVNSQFLRITRASTYPSTGPPSRQISQEYLRRWERCVCEDLYIVNHTAGFNRCSTELQHFSFYCATIAYHVGLNALLVAARHHDQRLRKKDIYTCRQVVVT